MPPVLRGGYHSVIRKVEQGPLRCASTKQRATGAYLSPGHHVEGGSLAEIFRCRRATKWLLLYAQPRTCEQSLQRIYRRVPEKMSLSDHTGPYIDLHRHTDFKNLWLKADRRCRGNSSCVPRNVCLVTPLARVPLPPQHSLLTSTQL
jgi:hypothetical protein